MGLTSALLRIPTKEHAILSKCVVISTQSSYKMPYCPTQWSGEHDIEVKHLITRHYQWLREGSAQNKIRITIRNMETLSETIPVTLILKYRNVTGSSKYFDLSKCIMHWMLALLIVGIKSC